MINQPKHCPFCNVDREILAENNSAVAIYDRFPVNLGHVLIFPRKHIENYFELSMEVQMDCIEILNIIKEMLQHTFEPGGFNIGINVNTVAGQTIPHAHIHVIPRYAGDVDNPRGGVRGVIPDKKEY